MTDDMIEITGINLKEFAKKVYELSSPLGLGYLHYKKDHVLSDEDAQACIDIVAEWDRHRIALNMDYVHGRCCKMVVFKEVDKLFIRNKWWDHTPEQLTELLNSQGIKNELKI